MSLHQFLQGHRARRNPADGGGWSPAAARAVRSSSNPMSRRVAEDTFDDLIAYLLRVRPSEAGELYPHRTSFVDGIERQGLTAAYRDFVGARLGEYGASAAYARRWVAAELARTLPWMLPLLPRGYARGDALPAAAS